MLSGFVFRLASAGLEGIVFVHAIMSQGCESTSLRFRSAVLYAQQSMTCYSVGLEKMPGCDLTSTVQTGLRGKDRMAAIGGTHDRMTIIIIHSNW